MRWKDWIPWSSLAIAVGIALWLVGWPKPPTQPADYAAWWQAVFSVAAIIAAVLLANMQHARERWLERRRELEVRFDRAGKIAEVLAYALKIADELPKKGATRVENLRRAKAADLPALDRAIATLEGFGASDVPTGVALVLLLGSVDNLQIVRGCAGLAFQLLNVAPGLEWHGQLDAMDDARELVRGTCHTWFKDLEDFQKRHGLAS